MSVSYPKGMMPPKPGLSPKGPTGGPIIKSAIAAPGKQPVKGIGQTSNPYTRATHHHGMIGKALEAKNHALAMHHTGHMLQALKQAGSSSATGVTAPPTDTEEIGENYSASGTDDGPTSAELPPQTKQPSTAQSPPAGKKPANIKAFFGAMKAKAGGYPNG